MSRQEQLQPPITYLPVMSAQFHEIRGVSISLLTPLIYMRLQNYFTSYQEKMEVPGLKKYR